MNARAALKRWPLAKACAMVLDDARWGLRLRAGRLDTWSGSGHARRTVPESVAYVEDVVADYLRHGGLGKLHGRAAEVGPGDSAGVAMLLRAHGCEHVDLVDRYRSVRDAAQQQAIAEALDARHGLRWLRRGGAWDEAALDGIQWHVGRPAEAFFADAARAGQPRYDLIVSRSVLEHLYDPLGALRSMAACLAPGGTMVHKVDLRDHGMFTPEGDDFAWLGIPTALYRRGVRHSGRPNRVLFHAYREALGQLGRDGFQVEALVTRLAGVGDLAPPAPAGAIPAETWRIAESRVASRRAGLAREFRDVPARDLAVGGCFLTVHRRAS